MEEGLLHHLPTAERDNKGGGGGGGVVTRLIGEIKEEGQRLCYIAVPMTTMSVSLFLIPISSSMMVGHLGELALSSTAIATSLTAVTGFSLLQGMASGLETLCGQGYGAQKYEKLGIHTYAAIFSLILICIPISLLWASFGNLLPLIGQDPLISREAGRYAVWMIPGLFANAIAQPMMKFLQSQSLTLPMLLASASSLCLHIPLCWVLVFKSSLRNVGAALSISISYSFYVFMLGLYIKLSESCKATRAPISKEAFRCINEFMKLAVPSAIMLCLQWWSFEIVILLSGLLPNPKLETSVLSICLTSIQCLYTIPAGLGAAVSTRVSNELGAGKPEGAQLSVRVVMFIAVTEAVTMSMTLFALRGIVGYAYSNEKEVIDNVMKMVPLICISVIMDSLQGVISGIARGCGWQNIGAYVNLGSLYLFGIPMALVLGFLFDMRGKGLWIGIVGGATVQTILLTIVTSCTNWQQQAKMARNRIFEERLPLET